jgi:hypothetical protein
MFFKREGIIASGKFHGSVNAASDVKVPLYIHSRYNDLKRNNTPFF